MASSSEARVVPGTTFFGSVHERNVGAVRKLLEVTLPVRYSDKFYRDVVKTSEDFTKIVYFNDLMVGVVACRVEARPDGKKRLYVAVIAVLEAYRGLGIGSALMAEVDAGVARHPEIVELYLHVQTSNAAAVRFYERQGFTVVGEIASYYSLIDPPHALLLRKVLGDNAPTVDLTTRTTTGDAAASPATSAAGAAAEDK